MDREQALEVALGQIERQFGKGSVMKMSDQAQVAIPSVSTGSLSLDLALARAGADAHGAGGGMVGAALCCRHLLLLSRHPTPAGMGDAASRYGPRSPADGIAGG